MKPLVSVITPSYNQGRFIRETIESVLSQDYENIEYIIVDGLSTDNSVDIIKEYEGKLTFVSEKDHGQSDAINKGFRMAHGDIVAWLNSDDVYEPHCISRTVEEFEANEKLGLLYGDGYIIDAAGNKLKVFEYTQEFDYWKLVNFWDYIMQPAAFFRSGFLRQVGYLDENLHYCMDWDLWIKLAAVSEVKYIPELLACSREYGDTKTSTGGDKRLEEIINLLQKYSGKENPPGVTSYRASTFYTKHADNIWPFRKFAGFYLACVHKWLDKRIPVRYADGWIGKKYALVVPGYVKNVKFVFQVVLPQLLPQKVDLFIDEVKAVQIEFLQCGIKEINVPLSGRALCRELRVCADKTVVAGNGDKRRVSLKIKDIILSEE